MALRNRLFPPLAGGLCGAAIVTGGLAVGGVFKDDASSPAAPVRAAAPVAAQPVSAVTTKGTTDLSGLYAAASPSVAEIRAVGVTEQSNSPFPDPRDEQGIATGTGFVADSDGTIVTNAHVVSTSKDVSVRFGEHDAFVKATVLGKDESSDVAVLHVDPSKFKTPLKALTLADSSDTKVGQSVLAIGNPFGLDKTATAGIISATDREIQAPNGFAISGALQTDAPINPGNSGGPLLDAAGQVIGINSQIQTGSDSSGSSSDGNVGIGFAVPSKTVAEVLPQLKAGKTIARPYLGIQTAERTQEDGATVASIVSGGPAAGSGLRRGDVITAIDGKGVTGPDGVSGGLAGKAVGDTITVTVKRSGQSKDITVKLGTRPATAANG